MTTSEVVLNLLSHFAAQTDPILCPPVMAEQKAHVAAETSSHHSSSDSATKGAGDHVEQIHTNERVSSHAQYYEKDGLRTYGDGEDHDAEPRVCPRIFPPLQMLTYRR